MVQESLQLYPQLWSVHDPINMMVHTKLKVVTYLLHLISVFQHGDVVQSITTI
jgi:hypothetical protein